MAFHGDDLHAPEHLFAQGVLDKGQGGSRRGTATAAGPLVFDEEPVTLFQVLDMHVPAVGIEAGAHVPVRPSQAWHGPQATGVPATQWPAPSQASSPSQRSKSGQAVPAGSGFVVQPTAGSQTAVTQGSKLRHWSGVPPVQTPFWQVSPTVQALPSLQLVPSGLSGLEH